VIATAQGLFEGLPKCLSGTEVVLPAKNDELRVRLQQANIDCRLSGRAMGL